MQNTNFLDFRSRALQGLGLKGVKLPNHWSKDDVEKWILKELHHKLDGQGLKILAYSVLLIYWAIMILAGFSLLS